MSDVNGQKDGPTLPEAIASGAGMPTGSAERTLHDPKPRSAGETAQLDPHARPADHTLRPDPTGARDPLMPGAALDPHGRTADFSNTNTGAGSAGGVRDQIQDRVHDVADHAREQAGAIQDRIGQATDEAGSRIRSAYGDARNWVSDVQDGHRRRIDDLTDRSRDGLERGRTAVESFVNENPLLVGVVGVAAGLLLGALLPRTRQEDRNLGPLADEVRDQGLRYAREFTSRGRDFVQTALDPDNLNAAARKATGTDAPDTKPADPVRHTL